MQIYDNLIPLEYQEKIKRLLESNNIDWYLHNSNVPEYEYIFSEKKDENIVDNVQFSHLFYGNNGNHRSDQFELLIRLLDIIEQNLGLKKFTIIRIKANVLTPSRKNFGYNVPHVDCDFKTKSVIYYVNESDGDTIIFKEDCSKHVGKYNIDKKISPRMGRMLLFDSSKCHTSSCPKNSKYRIILNIIYDDPSEKEKNALEYIFYKTINIKHSKRTFYEHLFGVYKILKSFNLSQDVCLAGLFHSVYVTKFFTIINVDEEEIKKIIGTYSNFLIKLFSKRDLFYIREHEVIINNKLNLSKEIIRDLLYIEYANSIEQEPKSEKKYEFILNTAKLI